MKERLKVVAKERDLTLKDVIASINAWLIVNTSLCKKHQIDERP
jgi:hypothetical protein